MLPRPLTGACSVLSAPPPTLGPRRSARTPRASSSGVTHEQQQQQLPRAPGAARVVELGLSGARRREVHVGISQHDADRSGGAGQPHPHLQQHEAPTAFVGAGVEGSPGPLAAVRDFFLPRGWPHSVTPDYLHYQLATVPAHITGWLSHSLATSSMIQALGMGMSPAATVATSAAIKWITKDGLGAAGRLIVGGRLASVFDEDPRRWRMVAEGVSTMGLALEIATQVFPGQFVLLAGGGTLAKSMAKGMGRPCFRVIQTHFSATNNVGDVAAKEEVWEVAAQLAGLASSVLLLQMLQAAGHPEAVIPVWATAHSVHVVLRYVALSSLRFPYPNQKRAALLASGHVSTGSVPSIDEANSQEQILLPPSACSPRVVFGCTLEEVLAVAEAQAGRSSSNASSSGSSNGNVTSNGNSASAQSLQEHHLEQLLQLYAGERYLLTWHDSTAWVALLEGASRLDMLRAMWQAAWLEHSSSVAAGAQSTPAAVGGAGSASGTMSSGSNGSEHNGATAAAAVGAAAGTDGDLLRASLAALCQQWPDFEAQAAAQGWQLDKAVLPQGRARLRLE